MAKKAKEVKQELSIEALAIGKEIAEATVGPMGFCYVEVTPAVKSLIEAGYVEVNDEVKDESGKIAARVTDKGKEFNAAPVETVETMPVSDLKPSEPEAVIPEQPTNGFVIASVPLPEGTRTRRGKATVYPFDKLEVGQSFFLPNVIEDGKEIEAKIKYASTVSSATQRFAVEDPESTREKKTLVKDEAGNPVIIDGKRQYNVETVQGHKFTRKFRIESVSDGAPWGQPGVKGAGVWRVA